MVPWEGALPAAREGQIHVRSLGHDIAYVLPHAQQVPSIDARLIGREILIHEFGFH